MKDARPILDISAIGLSGLCLAHCLVLPFAAIALPMLGAMSDAEWVHYVMLAIAAPLSTIALFRGPLAWRAPAMPAAAAAGLGLMAAGAAGWPVQDAEMAMTAAGGLLLAAAHGWNWRCRAAGRG